MADTIRALALVFALSCPPVCAIAAELPTLLTVPSEAKQLIQLFILDGRAYQTSFTLKTPYPATPALDHYSQQLAEPWTRCEWIPKWERFLDGTVNPVQTVHQHGTVWINPEQRRSLMLAMRYLSPGKSAGNPRNENQHVIVVEYFDQDVKELVSLLKLKCPK